MKRQVSSSFIGSQAPRHFQLFPLLHCLLGFLFLKNHNHLLVEASSSTPEVLAPNREGIMTTDTASNDIRVVFSDVDGTLVHYPDKEETEQAGNTILKLPPSATGMQGIISSKTMVYCRELRGAKKQKLVLVSGMRTTTLLKRLSYLPRADAYCSEAGGRIFYPCEPNGDGTFTPVPFDGALPSDLTSFGLEEDLEWRRQMEKATAAGMDGYETSTLLGSQTRVPNVEDRSGLLWEYARTLISKGYVLDTNGYSTCFRVNRKQQTKITNDEFDALMEGKVPRPNGLGTSTNLGCVDFYPIESGKKNCCLYLARKFCGSDDKDALSKHAICLCDDDNDLEMALACQHAFVPGVSSDSMEQVIQQHPWQLTATGGPGQELEGTRATEKALELALEMVSSDSS